jgi:hypothetical protein
LSVAVSADQRRVHWLGRVGRVEGDQVGVVRPLPAGAAQDPEAFPPHRGDQPAGQPVRVLDAVQVLQQPKPPVPAMRRLV